MLKWKLFLAILFSSVCFPLYAQSPGQLLAFAKEQHLQGNYSQATKSLSRLLFFDNGTLYPEVFSLLADSYFRQHDFTNAYYFYDLAVVQTENDSLRAEFTASKIACRLYNKEFHEAQIDLLSFTGKLNPSQQWQFNMLAGLTWFYLDDYDQSKFFLMKCADGNSPGSIEAVENGFRRIEKLGRRYNPRISRVLSIVVPGSGQVFAGDYRNGINSLLLITGLVAASVGLSSSISFIDAAIIIFPWFQRYYMGGYQKAFVIAGEKQLAEKNKTLAAMISSLKNPELK